jgi:hypothetical protein
MNKEEKLLTKLVENEEKIDKIKDKHKRMKTEYFDSEFFETLIVSLIAIAFSIIIGLLFFSIDGQGLAFLFGPAFVAAVGVATLFTSEPDFGINILFSPIIIIIDILSALVYLRHIVKIKTYEYKNRKIEEKINELESINKKKEMKEELLKSKMLEEEQIKKQEKAENIDHAVIKEFYFLLSKTNEIKNEKYRDLYSTKINTLLNEYDVKIRKLLYEQVTKAKEIELSNTSLLALDNEYIQKCRKIELQIDQLKDIEKEIQDIEEEELLVTDLINKNKQTLTLRK